MAKYLTDAEWNKLADAGLRLQDEPTQVDEGEKKEMLDLLQEFGGSTFLIAKRLQTKQRHIRAKILRLGIDADRKRLTRPEGVVLRELLDKHGGPASLALHLNYSEMGLRGRLKRGAIATEELGKFNRKRRHIDPAAAKAAMEKWDGSVRRAAIELGVSYTCLYLRLDELGLRGMTDEKPRRPLYRNGKPIPPAEEPEAIFQALDEKSWDWYAAAGILGCSFDKLRDRVKFLNLKDVAKERYQLWKATNPDRLRLYVERLNQPLSAYVRKGEPSDDDF